MKTSIYITHTKDFFKRYLIDSELFLEQNCKRSFVEVPRNVKVLYNLQRAGLLDSGHGPEGGRRGGRSPSQGPQVSPVGQGGQRRRGAAAGQRGPSRRSRGPGSPLSTRPPPPPPFCLPLGVAAAALRCRFPGCGHFPASRARGPRTGGFCPPGRGERARRRRPPALRGRPSPCVCPRVAPRRPRFALRR